MVTKKLHESRLRRRREKIEAIYYAAKEENQQLSDIPQTFIDSLKKLSLNRLGLEAFTSFYIEEAERVNYSDEICDFAARVIDYDTLVKANIVRNQYRSSYILFLLSRYRVKNDESKALALKSLDDKSMYVRNNALFVIKNTGDTEAVISALKIIGEEKRYFNNKMIIDFFDTFRGDYTELNLLLVQNFDKFSLFIKRLIPAHFMNQRDDSEPVRSLILSCLSDSDKELIIAATKYFGWVNDKRATELIMKNISHSEWEIRALSARISQRGYTVPGIIDALRVGLSDRNWYVRQNCAFAYVAAVNGERKSIQPIIEGSDRYAREVILYVMFTKGILEYDLYQYILRYQSYITAVADGEIQISTNIHPEIGIKAGSFESRAYYANKLAENTSKEDLEVFAETEDELTKTAIYFIMYMKDMIDFAVFEELTVTSEKSEKPLQAV
jgi:HEAT repeat protein